MDSQAQLVVKDQESILFLETPSRKLLLPTARVQAGEDFVTAARRCIAEKLSLNCVVQGVVKVQHHTGMIVKQTEKLVVTFLAERRPGRPGLGGPTDVPLKWLKTYQLHGLSSFVLDPPLRMLVESVCSGGMVYPLSLVECLDVRGAKKGYGVFLFSLTLLSPVPTGPTKHSEVELQRRETEFGCLMGEEGIGGGGGGGGGETTLEDQMLEQSGYTSHELSLIREDYMKRCGGSDGDKMTLEQFTDLLTELGYPANRCTKCFRALTGSPDSESISLKEVTVGLCALDPTTPHGGLSAQFRCQFIFAFYNVSHSGTLSFSEFREMMKDICLSRRIEKTEEEMEQATLDNWRIFEVPENEGITLPRFLFVVGQLRFRGTSGLFRLPRSPFKSSSSSSSSRTLPSRVRELSPGPGPLANSNSADPQPGDPSAAAKSPKQEKKVSFSGIEPGQKPEEEEDGEEKRIEVKEEMEVNGGMDETDGVKDKEENDKEKEEESMSVDPEATLPGGMPAIKLQDQRIEDMGGVTALDDDEFSIATHFVKVRRSGAVADVTTLWDLVGTDMVSGSLDNVLSARPGFDRLPSLNAFDKQSKSNEMLSGLRYFEHALRDNGRGQPKQAFSWGAVDMGSVAKCFMELCAKAMDVFSSEPRLLEISSPTYVLGDLHGNFHDLICFEKVLWRMGPILTPASFLFLGDYVDRGEYGFEVVAYIFAQKLLMPSKFLLIRGNHEIRAVQETFSYKIECMEKFGPELGLEVWEATNKAFDTMPVAAVIDKKVFCVHGGIPLPTLGDGLISSIADVPVNLSNPMEDSQLAWDIMWNDPIRSNEIDDVIEKQLEDNCGFIDNFARGTAHMFNSVALQEFLMRNKLSHVIRAHECMAAGFQLQQNGRLLTVFSSSHYCGATNEAACVLVHNRKIRTIRLDTT